jgi:hypothetical protein
MLRRSSTLLEFLLVPLAGSLLVTACNGDHVTGVTTAQPCGNNPVVQLNTLQAATIACSSGNAFTLTGGGASYLIVPQFATGSAPDRLNAYTIGVTNGVAGRIAIASGPSLDRASTLEGNPNVPPGVRLQLAQRTLDALLMADARRRVESGEWHPRLVPPSTPLRASTPPPLNSTRQFHVLSSESPIRFSVVTAQLSYIGTNILIYIDQAAPPNGFTQSQLQSFGALFDQTLYPIDTANFGPPTDIDQNGRLIMLLSPMVNALTPKADCGNGFVAGFFEGDDLGGSDTSSNRGEIFYTLVPDPNATVSCAHSVAELEETTGATFLHEVQHLINFGQHVLVHRSSPEFGWLDEGLSIVAEELGSLYYETRYPPPLGRTDPAQIFPDSSQGYIAGLLDDSYEYLLKPDTASVTLHSDADDGLAWRGGDWLLVRWLGDQKGSGIFKALVQTGLTGTTNIANAAGEPFDGLFGDFSLALYTDSLRNIPKSQIPPRNRFAYRNLRRMYARLNQNEPSVFPRVFPIVPTSLTGAVSASMVPGTMSFYRLDTTSGQSTVTIKFAAPDGSPISSALHPQVSVFRLPPGT